MVQSPAAVQSVLSKSGGLHWVCLEFSFAVGTAAACGGVSGEFGFPARDRGDLLIRSGSLLERSPFVLAARLSRRHDHRYGILSLSALSPTQRHAGQAGLFRTRAGHSWFVCRLFG